MCLVRHNEDGSYTYGYEGADGAFKIETKLANGEVMGKYGYVDDTGNVRVVEYGANKYGFQPAGEGITVPPPTLVDESAVKKSSKSPLESKESVEYDDGQYYEEAPRAAPPPPPVRQAPRPAPRPAQRVASRPVPQPQFAPDDTYSTFSSTQNFGPSRPVSFGPSSPSFDPSSRSFGPSSPSFGPSSPSFGPAPPRAAVAGAVPVGPPTSYSQPRALSAPPRPVSRPQPQPQPQQSFFNPASAPAPVYESRPVAAAAPSSSRGGFGRSSSILDQLEKDFALPSNSAPALHDITFGSSYWWQKLIRVIRTYFEI